MAKARLWHFSLYFWICMSVAYIDSTKAYSDTVQFGYDDAGNLNAAIYYNYDSGFTSMNMTYENGGNRTHITTTSGANYYPTFYPSGSRYYSTPQNVTISGCVSPNSPRYIFGSYSAIQNKHVNSSSTIYGTPVTIGYGRSLIKAACYPSPAVEAVQDYIINASPPVTTASPQGGFFGQSMFSFPTYLKCTDTLSGCSKIYYTLDGSTPTTSSSIYTSPFYINNINSNSTTLKYFAVNYLGIAETVKTQVYNFDVIAPTTTASPGGGNFTTTQTVTLTCNDGTGSGCSKIYYTTDGTTPTTASSVYISPLSIPLPTTFKYFATDNAGNTEGVKSQVYTGVDLAVTAIGPIMPSPLTPGGAIFVPVTVMNNGSGTAGSFSIGIYASTDSTITTGDTFIGSVTVSSLGSGAQTTVTANLTVPSTLAPGNYYIGAFADYLNSIPETNESNNTLATTTPVAVLASGVDLTVTSIGTITPSPLVTGAPMSVPVTIKNNNSGTAAGFSVGIYMSTDSTITTGDLYLGSVYISSLGPGVQTTVTANLSVPSTLVAPGNYYIGAIADCFNNIAETNEANNTLATATPLTVVPGIDLTVTSVGPITPSPLVTGVPMSIPVTVQNTGIGTTELISIVIYASTDSTITNGDKYIGPVFVTSLGPGAQTTLNANITMPADLSPGNYYFGAFVDPYNSIAETNENNNTLATATPLTVISGIDLTVTSIGIITPSPLVIGSPISVPVTVQNIGLGTVGSISVGIYASTDSVITTGDTYIGSVSVPSLGPGAQTTVNANLSVPSTLAPGNYYIGAFADWINYYPETNKNNNTLATPTTLSVVSQ